MIGFIKHFSAAISIKSLVLFSIVFFKCAVFYSQNFADSLLNIKGGIYQNPVKLAVIMDKVDAYYTTDGTVPTQYSTKFDKQIELTTTTVIRIKAYKNGNLIGTTTQTYIIGRTFDMAVISIAFNPDDFFSYERGIYVKGCCAAESPPYQGANFWKKWERAINIEFYEPDGTLGFNQPAGARIFGGFSKGWPMKSLAIIAREKYGVKRFKYPIFPNKDIKKYKSFVLRNSGGDFNKTHFRDAFMTDLVAPLDIEIQAYRPAVVFFNGEYWGIHNVREKITEHYLANNCDVHKDSVDLLRHRGDAQFGSAKEYKKLLAFLQNNTFETSEKITALDAMMHIDNYINYNIAEVYIDNRDAGGNIRYWRERKPDGRWRWIFYDTDLSFGISDWKAYKVNTLFKMTNANTEIWPNPAWSTFIIRKLLENDSLKKVYSNRFADHLNTIFHPDNVLFKIDSIQNLLRNEMQYHIVKWPTLSLKSWEKNVQVLRDFATYRPQAMRGFIMEKFGWSDTVLIGLGDFDANQGNVKINSLLLNKGFYGWYFSGCPIMIEAKPNKGYEFVKWEGLSSKTAIVTIDPSEITTVFYPVFKKKALSKFANAIKLNEISSKQDSTIKSGDWIELYNASDKPIDLEGWKVINKENDAFIINQSFIIKSHSFGVLCKSPKKFKTHYSETDENLVFNEKMPFKLGGKNDAIYLLDTNDQLVDSLLYVVANDFSESANLENIVLSKSNPLMASVVSSWDLLTTATPLAQNSNFSALDTQKDLGILHFIKSYWALILSAISFTTLVLWGVLYRLKKK